MPNVIFFSKAFQWFLLALRQNLNSTKTTSFFVIWLPSSPPASLLLLPTPMLKRAIPSMESANLDVQTFLQALLLEWLPSSSGQNFAKHPSQVSQLASALCPWSSKCPPFGTGDSDIYLVTTLSPRDLEYQLLISGPRPQEGACHGGGALQMSYSKFCLKDGEGNRSCLDGNWGPHVGKEGWGGIGDTLL